MGFLGLYFRAGQRGQAEQAGTKQSQVDMYRILASPLADARARHWKLGTLIKRCGHQHVLVKYRDPKVP